MSKAVDIFSGILFVRTRHYEDVKKVVVLQGNKPERRFFEERPQGEWIKIKRQVVDKDVKFIYKCDYCGYVEIYEANFCGNCGVEMRGQEE